ncbi:unnamed protein product [Urochloa humidicola]
MGRRWQAPDGVLFEVTLLGSDGDLSKSKDGGGSSRRSSRKRFQAPERIQVRGVSARCSFSQCLVIDQERKIKFRKDDVGIVFGIPNSGRQVVANPRPKKEVVSLVLCDMIGLKNTRDRTIKSLLHVVRREYGSVMTPRECVSFKLAFVIYVMSTVLSPGSRFDHVYLDYVDALVDPDEIRSYDWSDFVFRKLIDAITHMKIGLRSTKKVANITGCSMFLQVLYLDSIDLGVWNLDHESRPRVKEFSGDRLKYMIRADTLEHTEDCRDRIFGTRQLLPPWKVCYTWAQGVERSIIVGADELKDSLRDATALLARVFNMANEETRNLFESLSGINGPDAGSRTVCVVASFLERYLRASRIGEDSRCRLKCAGRIDPKYCSTDVGESSYGHLNNWVDDSMYPLPLLFSPVEMPVAGMCNDGGDASTGGCDGYGREISLRSGSASVKEPWELGFTFRYTREASGVMLSEICSWYANCKGACTIGFCFKDVGMLIKEMQLKFFGDDELGEGVFDAVLRCVKCRDGSLYQSSGEVRWRHIASSCFMNALFRGNFDTSGVIARFNFHCDCVGYDVAACKMVFFPARLVDRWVCYAWNAFVNQWVVFDPLGRDFDGDNNRALHGGTVQLITDSVREVVRLGSSSFFPTCANDSEYVLHSDLRFSRMKRSGVACLHFCAMFDGVSIRGEPGLDVFGIEDHVTVAEALDALKSFQGP